ncbi:MAG: hypothetical protein QOC93_2236 [Actinomycetota bacterium]|nr:hypothetical protein [Actinomycetota bacterium]
MVIPFPRRRAERFAELLDARAGGTPVRSRDDELAELAGTAAALGAMPTPVMDPAYRERLRTRLVAVLDVQGPAPETAEPVRPRRRVPRRVVIAGPALAGVLAVSGIGAASTGAVPGDTLYGVKRSTESAQLTLASSDVNRGRLFLDFARTRIQETASVLGSTPAVVKTFDDMDEAARAGTRLLGKAAVDQQDRAPLDAVDGFVLAQRSDLAALLPSLGADGRDRALDSLVLLEQIQSRSVDLRGSLLCTTGYADEGGTDDLGPLPQRCAALPSTPAVGASGLPIPLPSGTAGTGILPDGTVPAGIPSLPGLGGVVPSGSGFTSPGYPGSGIPGMPGYTESDPGLGGLLDTVTGTVGGVVGGLLGPLVGGQTAAPSPTPAPTSAPGVVDRLIPRR